MKITISGEPQVLDHLDRVSELLQRIGIDGQSNGIAVAKNGVVIPKSRWVEERVNDGDRIEIVRASQGG